MPKETTQFYALSGLVTQDIYTESEMAGALGLSTKSLRSLLSESSYGNCPEEDQRSIYCAHVWPKNKEWEFKFNRSAFTANIRALNYNIWARQRWPDLPNYVVAEVVRAATREKEITEVEFAQIVEKEQALWQAKEGSTWQGYINLIEQRTRIWEATKFLYDQPLVKEYLGVRFFRDQDPPEGLFIGWENLSMHHKSVGFFDVTNHDAYTTRDCLPDPTPDMWVEYESGTTELSVGDMISGERWVMDGWVEFAGLITQVNFPNGMGGGSLWYTDNCLYAMPIGYDPDARKTYSNTRIQTYIWR